MIRNLRLGGREERGEGSKGREREGRGGEGRGGGGGGEGREGGRVEGNKEQERVALQGARVQSDLNSLGYESVSVRAKVGYGGERGRRRERKRESAWYTTHTCII